MEVTNLVQPGVVKQGGGKALNDANLGAQAQREQHHEEEGGPEGSSGDLGEDVRHHDEGETGSLGRVVQLLHQGTVLEAVSLIRVQSGINGIVEILQIPRGEINHNLYN